MRTETKTAFRAARLAQRIAGGFGEPEPPVHTAAGCLVAQEAGALVTDIDDGKPWRLESRSFLIAADPALHRELLDLTAECS